MLEGALTTVGTFAGAALSDYLASRGFLISSLGGAALTEAMKIVLAKRANNALAILSEEIRRGDRTLDEADLEGAAAVVYRLGRAAQEGAARLNLRLLAAVFSGQIVHGEIVADEFLAFADVLAPLRRQEIMLLGMMIKHDLFLDMEGFANFNVKYQDLHDDPELDKVRANAFEFNACCNGLLRTGLVSTYVHGGGAFGDSASVQFGGTPALRRLRCLADLEGVIAREDTSPAAA